LFGGNLLFRGVRYFAVSTATSLTIRLAFMPASRMPTRDDDRISTRLPVEVAEMRTTMSSIKPNQKL
jgi:hypothetical protein